VDYDVRVYAPIIHYLFQCQHLTQLSFHRGKKCLDDRFFDSASAAAPSPLRFPNLQQLTADVRRAAVPAITAALTHAPLLTRLSFLVPSLYPRGVMPSIGVLAATLQELHLEFDTDAQLECDEILSLRALTELRELVIQPPMNKMFFFLVRAPGFTDVDLVHLLAALPKLRRFHFGVRASWWPDGDDGLLWRIGQAAPLLEELGLAGSYSVQMLELSVPPPAFSYLQTLILCGFSLALAPSDADREEIEYLEYVAHSCSVESSCALS
jgi:hypothetical protein